MPDSAPTPLRILSLEDDAEFIRLVRATFDENGIDCQLTSVETREDFIEALNESSFDLVLADYSLPAFDGISAMHICRQNHPDLPFIFVSGSIGEELAIESLKNGATDYVLKEHLTRLVPSVRRALREAAHFRETKRAAEALKESEARYRTLFESAQDAIFMMRGETFLECNPHTLQMFGCGLDQIIGQTPMKFSPLTQSDGRDSVSKAGEKISASIAGLPQRFEWRHCRLDGTEFDAEVSLNRVDLNEEPLVLAVVRDITERKQAEHRLFQSREQLRALSARLQSLREEERTQIAREIHDHLGQLLTALKLDLRSIERRVATLTEPALRAALEVKITSARELTDETITSVQKIASELRPAILDRLGLEAAIEVETQAFQSRTGTHCEWTLPGSPLRTEPDQATAVFRIFQEILTNIARHAHASRVTVRLRQDQRELHLEVTDDGVGIQKSHLESAKSMGLLGMQERAEILGGSIAFERASGSGTAVKVRIPLDRRP